MSAQSATYSFLDLSVVINNPVLPAPITFAGNLGTGSLTVTMHTERTVLDTAADGTVMPSYVAGDSGAFTMEAQQTSSLHQALLDLYNTLKAAADNGDVSNWAATTISARNIISASQHRGTGVAFSKIPDKPYVAQGGRVTWSLQACNIDNA